MELPTRFASELEFGKEQGDGIGSEVRFGSNADVQTMSAPRLLHPLTRTI